MHKIAGNKLLNSKTRSGGQGAVIIAKKGSRHTKVIE